MTPAALFPRPVALPPSILWCGAHGEAGNPNREGGWKCPKCAGPAPAVAKHPVDRRPAGPRHACTLGHGHDSKGESAACPVVYAAATAAGLSVFRPGRPGIPCFCVAPDEKGRPCYVNIDWVLVGPTRKIVGLLDWKGETSQREVHGQGGAFPRGKRIIEQETGCAVRELKTLEDIPATVAGKEAP